MESLFDYFMFAYGGEIVALIVTAVFGMFGVVVKNIMKKHLNSKEKQDIARAVVLFAEQCFKDLHGPEKLQAAMNRASAILAEKGIDFSVTEMETLIEAAVAEFNETFKK